MNKLKFLIKQSLLLLILFILIPGNSGFTETNSIKTIAIIPFEINSQTDISYIPSGVLNMLYSRLSWQDNVEIVKKDTLIKALSSTKQPIQSNMIIGLGEKTNADYVITGSITEFSGAYSIDTKVYNLKEKSFLTFYGQSKTIDKVISTVDIIAAKINKKIFNRTTSSYEKFKKEKIITEEQLKRMNPEQMMPVSRTRDDEKKPWWKIW